MKATSIRRASLAGLAAAVLALSAATAAPAGEKSLADQLKVLNGALVESFTTRDWEMLELVAGGVKAAGLKGADVEMFVLRAERDAAFKSARARGTILSWGLAFRAKLGSKDARATLRKAAFSEPEPVESPGRKKLSREESLKAWAAYRKYTARRAEADAALLALAMLGEKDVKAPALERIRAKGAPRNVRVLVFAALAADAEASWKELVKTCSTRNGGAVPFSTRTSILSTLAGLAGKDKTGKHSAGFRIEGSLAKKVPADSAAQLRKAFISLISDAQAGTRDSWTLLWAARAIPGLKEDAAAMTALKALGGKMTGHAAKSWNTSLERFLGKKPTNGADVVPEKF